MAFENTEKTTVSFVSRPLRQWTALIICGSFLVVCLVLSYFQKPIQTSWHNWRVNRVAANQIVQLPPILIASPITTPAATIKPNLTPLPITVASPTPTLYQVPIASSVPQGNLPKTGPSPVTEALILLLTGASSFLVYRYYQLSFLKRVATNVHIS